jgi:hypothetical protein
LEQHIKAELHPAFTQEHRLLVHIKADQIQEIIRVERPLQEAINHTSLAQALDTLVLINQDTAQLELLAQQAQLA